MYALDFSIDNLSLMALTLAVGFIVDDAIVMLENIVRHIEMGKTPMQAALDGAAGSRVHRSCRCACRSSAVFIPLMFMGGIIGRLFREFAVTISVAMLVSGFVALTLTPMLCSRLLKPHARREARPVVQRHRARRSRRALARVRAQPRVGDAAPAADARRSRRSCSSRRRASCGRRSRRACSRPTTPGRSTRTREAAQGTSFTEMLRYGQLVSAQARDGHERRVVHDERRRRHGAVESGAVQHHAEAGGPASAGRRDGARAARA